MNSLLLRRRCAGTHRVGVTKIYVTGGEYQWFSPETYQKVNHFYFTTSNLDNNMHETPYNYSFIIGTVSGIKTNNTANVKLVYDSSSYTVNSWCFNVSNVKFKLAPQIVPGGVTWIITATFTITPKSNYCHSDLSGNDMVDGKITFLDLQNYPGFWEDEYCYFTIKSNSIYVETTDDLVTDSISFTKTNISKCEYAGKYPTKTFNVHITGYDEGTYDDPTGYSFYTIPEQTNYLNLSNTGCIESIYIKDYRSDSEYYGGNCYLTSSITQTTTGYKLSMTVRSSPDAFEKVPFGGVPKLGLVIQYYDIPA